MDNTKLTIVIIRTLVTRMQQAHRRVELALRLVRDYRVRYERLVDAGDALREINAELGRAFAAAAWGRHDHGRVFVQRWSGFPSRSDRTTSRVNIDGLPVATVAAEFVRQRDGEYEVEYEVRLHDEAEERELRDRDRDRARAAAEEQAAMREAIAADLRRGRAPRGVVAVDGQRGGYLAVGAERLAIRGVLKAAGITPGDHPYNTWTTMIADLTTVEPEARVRARNLPPKVRHLRAPELRG